MSSPLMFCTSAFTLEVMLSWWQYRAMRCKYASRSFLVDDSGHWSAICRVSLSSLVPASEIFLAALITSIVVFNGPRPLQNYISTVKQDRTIMYICVDFLRLEECHYNKYLSFINH